MLYIHPPNQLDRLYIQNNGECHELRCTLMSVLNNSPYNKVHVRRR